MTEMTDMDIGKTVETGVRLTPEEVADLSRKIAEEQAPLHVDQEKTEQLRDEHEFVTIDR